MKNLLRYLMICSAAAFIACDNGDDNEVVPPPPLPPPDLEGMYIHGTNTIAELATDQTARMQLAVLDPGQGAKVETMEGVYGKFLYIGANGTLQFTEVDEDKNVTVFGAEAGGAVDSASVVGNVPIKDVVVHGTLLADGEAIKVADEGLYYAYVNANTDQFIVMKVKAQMIGDATLLQWNAGTDLPLKSVSKDSAVFEGTNIQLMGETGYRYRFNDGWHVYQDPNIVTLSSLGVPSYGEAWDSGINDVGFHLENIPHKETGLWTVRLKYDADTDEWTETKIKTGDVLIDYTDYEMSIFGNAYVTAPEDTASWTSGEDGYGLHTPEKSGNVYTWSWEDIDLIQDRAFIFLQNGAWGGLIVNFQGATNEGTAIENGQIINAMDLELPDPNYYVVEGGTYDITLTIDAAANTKTVTIDAN